MDMHRIGDRLPVIRPYVVDKEVLDLGCVGAHPAREGSDARLERKPDVLFRRIAEANPNTIGVDIDSDGVTLLARMGYNVLCADVETMNLEREFDTIVAGEIIEHLENPGLFLRNMRRHLKPGGTIIISTPNPFYTGQTWKIWRYGLPTVHDEHVNWQDPVTLGQLLRRTGYETVEGYWVQPETKLLKTWKRLLRPYFAHSFMLIARPATTTAVTSCESLPACRHVRPSVTRARRIGHSVVLPSAGERRSSRRHSHQGQHGLGAGN